MKENRPVLIGDTGFQPFQPVGVAARRRDLPCIQLLPAGFIGGEGKAGVFPQLKGQFRPVKAAHGLHSGKEGHRFPILGQPVVIRLHQHGREGSLRMGDLQHQRIAPLAAAIDPLGVHGRDMQAVSLLLPVGVGVQVGAVFGAFSQLAQHLHGGLFGARTDRSTNSRRYPRSQAFTSNSTA